MKHKNLTWSPLSGADYPAVDWVRPFAMNGWKAYRNRKRWALVLLERAGEFLYMVRGQVFTSYATACDLAEVSP